MQEFDFSKDVLTVNGHPPDENGNVEIVTFRLDDIYAVGDLYITTSQVNPAERWAGTSWELFGKGRTLIGATNFEGDSGDYDGTVYNAGDIGGEETHTLNANEMPSHAHSAWTDAQGWHGHNIRLHNNQSDGSSGNGAKYDHSYMANTSTDGAGTHGHNVGIGATGGDGAHNNMQPYIATYFWLRTA